MASNTMASNRKNYRKSLAFSTPQMRRLGASQSRFSLSNVQDEADEPDKDTDELYQTLMSDPMRKAIFMQFLQSNSKVNDTLLDVMKKKADNKPSPVNKKKFESPTTQFRRRALKELESDKLSSDDSLSENLTPLPVPFNQLLKGVVAYVEIICNDQDKSGGAKALLTSMGARVVDKIRKGVTHVIYKDGSFQTCRKAKYVNAYLVSVLWLEAVRKNRCKVSEEKYPPFATQTFNANVSDLCEQMQLDYEEVVKDEMERGGNFKRSKSSSSLGPKYSEDIIESSPESNIQSVVSARASPRKSMPAAVTRLVFSPEVSSGSDSDIELIDGEIIHRSPADLSQYSIGSIERETILAINGKLKDFDSSHSANQSSLNLNNSESLGRRSLVRQEDRSKSSSISKKKSHADELMKENVNHTNAKKSLTDLQNSESVFSKNRDTKSLPMSELQISNSATKTVTRNGRRKTINSSASEQLRVSDSIKNKKPTKESAGISDSSKNDGSESAILSDWETSDTSNKKLPLRSSRRKTVCSSSVNDLSCFKASDPIKRVSHKNNGKSVDVAASDILAKKTAGVSDSSKIGGTVSSEFLDLEISDSSDKRLSRNSRRKTSNSSMNELSQLRVSDPVQTAAASAPMSMLRISDASSKRRQIISSTKSSLSISTASSKSSGDVHRPEVQDDEFPPKTSGAEKIRGSNTNVTLRRKRPINKDLVHAFDKSDDTSDQPKKNIRKGKRRLYDPNNPPSPITPNIVGKKTTESRNKKNTKGEKNTNSNNSLNISNVEIAPVFMTPSASALLKKRMPDIVLQLDAASNFSADSGETNSIVPMSSKYPSPPKKSKMSKSKAQPEPTKVIFKEPKTPIARKRAQSQNTVAVTPTRRSTRVRESISASQSDEELKNPIRLQSNGRKTQEFLPKETFRSQTKLKNTQSKQHRQSSIVCSRFHREEVQVFRQIVTKLGRFWVEDEVMEKTTHLVIAEPKRTINLLRAMARGCWVLKAEWLYKSLEEGKWLQEDDYEMTDYSSAVQKSRRQREAFGVSYSMDIFKDCGNIYIAKSSNPRCSDLQELVTLCKGRITTIYRNATIVIGENVDDDDVTCVTENWVLDCITFYKKLSPKNYLLKPPPRRQSQEF